MKRILLSLIAILTLSVGFAAAKNKTVKVDGNTYELFGGTQAALIKGNKKATDVVIANTISYDGYTYPVVEIRESAFSGYKNLRSVTIPKNVYKLDNYCFSGCSSLREVKFETESLTLHSRVFSGCSSLEEINLPLNTSTYNGIGINHYQEATGCFKGCSSLRRIKLPKSFDRVDNYMFDGCSSLEEIIIVNPNCIIGRQAFDDCPNLKAISIWGGGAKNLTEAWCFDPGIWCANDILMRVPIGLHGSLVVDEYITKVTSRALSMCKLSSLTLPNVSSVHAYAFWPSEIDELILGKATPPSVVDDRLEIDNTADFSQYIKKLIVPKGSKVKYQNAPGWKTIKVIEER